MFHCPSAPVLGRSSLLWDCKISLSLSMSWISSYFDPGSGQSMGNMACCHGAASLLGSWNQIINEGFDAIENKGTDGKGLTPGPCPPPPTPGHQAGFPQEGS